MTGPLSFPQQFAELPDPRSHVNRTYELLDIAFLTVCAGLSGAEGWKDIKKFGHKKPAWLRRFRRFEAGIPVAGPATDQGRSFRGFNLFQDRDYQAFLALGRGEWSISGFRAADLRTCMPDLSPSQSSYLLKRLRTHVLLPV